MIIYMYVCAYVYVHVYVRPIASYQKNKATLYDLLVCACIDPVPHAYTHQLAGERFARDFE
jgi:hypothetical protein